MSGLFCFLRVDEVNPGPNERMNQSFKEGLTLSV